MLLFQLCKLKPYDRLSQQQLGFKFLHILYCVQYFVSICVPSFTTLYYTIIFRPIIATSIIRKLQNETVFSLIEPQSHRQPLNHRTMVYLLSSVIIKIHLS